MDWSLFGRAARDTRRTRRTNRTCGLRLMALTAAATAWRCLRYGTFVTHDQPGKEHGKVQHGKVQHGSGGAAAPPGHGAARRADPARVRGGAVHPFRGLRRRGLRVWRFTYDRADIQRAFNNDLPAIRALYRDLGFNVDHSKLLGLIQHSFALDARALTWWPPGWPSTRSSS